MIHTSSRFPSVRLCVDCIKKAQKVLFAIHGKVPRIPWLVVSDGHWLMDTTTATIYPYRGES